MLECKTVQCSVHKSVQCWNAKPFNIQFTKSVQCWNAKPFNVQFTKVSSAGMSKANVEQLMSTKSIQGASGVVISTRCKAQRKVQKQDVKVLRYAKQGAAIPVKNRSKKNSCPPSEGRILRPARQTPRLDRG